MYVDVCCFLNCIVRFVREKVHPVVKTEEQFLFLCHLVGPFLQRFNTDRPRCVTDLTVELYELLEQVDKNVAHMNYMDPICDLLYPFILTNFQLIFVVLRYVYNYITECSEFSMPLLKGCSYDGNESGNVLCQNCIQCLLSGKTFVNSENA
jgi:hypothetical protein